MQAGEAMTPKPIIDHGFTALGSHGTDSAS